MRYLVDMGENGCKLMGAHRLRWFYDTHINKNEYASLDDWLWDMMRCGLVTPIV